MFERGTSKRTFFMFLQVRPMVGDKALGVYGLRDVAQCELEVQRHVSHT
jgi:hypothetical protein